MTDDYGLAAFDRTVSDFCSAFPEQLASEAFRKLALEALRRLVYKTPVKTGRARGGWQVVTLGKGTILRGLAAMAGRMEKADPDGAETIRRGMAEIEQVPGFSIIDVENHVEYIIRLEEGHSKQAPQGMLALTFDELVSPFSGMGT